MAKNSNHHADGFGADDTGGLLSGLLAEEEDLDRRALWRLGSWGVGAVGAVVVAVMANQSSLGLKREQTAAAELSRQAQQIQTTARENLSETRRLASAVDTLNGDRDRLYTRVTSLEQGLDTVTGSFIRQLPPNAKAQAQTSVAPEPMVAVSPPPVVAPVVTAAPATDKPAVKSASTEPTSAGAKTDSGKAETAKADVAKADAPRADAAKAEPVKSESAKLEPAKLEPAKADLSKLEAARTSAATPAMPLVAAQSFMAPPDPSATKLIEPEKPTSAVSSAPIPEVIAAAPSVDPEEAQETAGPAIAVQKTEFGVDLGSANSVNGLRALWRGLLKSRSNASLAALRPVIKIKEAGNGLGMQLRLVAGPLNDAGAAARICAVMTENDRTCETTVFDGQRLSFKSDEVAPAQPTPTRPANRVRRSGSKRAAVAPTPVEEPKKPETTASISSSISTMFGRKSTQ